MNKILKERLMCTPPAQTIRTLEKVRAQCFPISVVQLKSRLSWTPIIVMGLWIHSCPISFMNRIIRQCLLCTPPARTGRTSEKVRAHALAEQQAPYSYSVFGLKPGKITNVHAAPASHTPLWSEFHNLSKIIRPLTIELLNNKYCLSSLVKSKKVEFSIAPVLCTI